MKLPFVSRDRFESLEHALAEEKAESRRLLDLLLEPFTKKEVPVAVIPAIAGEVDSDKDEAPASTGSTPMDRVVTDMHRHFKGATPPVKWRARG